MGRATAVRFLNVNAAIRGLILGGLLLAATGAALFFTLNARATAATDCSWGASSMSAYVDAQGAYHESLPATTGCAAP